EFGRETLDLCNESVGDVLGSLVLEFDQHPGTGGAFHECRDRAGAVRTDDEVAFPMAGHRPVLDLGWPLRDHDHARDPCRVRDPASRPALCAPGPQTPGEFFA